MKAACVRDFRTQLYQEEFNTDPSMTIEHVKQQYGLWLLIKAWFYQKMVCTQVWC